MLGRILLFIVLVPLIELVLLYQFLERFGLPTTLLVVFATGIIGLNLARQQGTKAWRMVHQQLGAGRSPSHEILHGVMILIAGAFLMTPGLITDVVGFLLLVPAVRLILGQWLVKWFKTQTVASFKVQGFNADASPFAADDTSAAPPIDDHEQPSVRVVAPDESPRET